MFQQYYDRWEFRQFLFGGVVRYIHTFMFTGADLVRRVHFACFVIEECVVGQWCTFLRSTDIMTREVWTADMHINGNNDAQPLRRKLSCLFVFLHLCPHTSLSVVGHNDVLHPTSKNSAIRRIVVQSWWTNETVV